MIRLAFPIIKEFWGYVHTCVFVTCIAIKHKWVLCSLITISGPWAKFTVSNGRCKYTFQIVFLMSFHIFFLLPIACQMWLHQHCSYLLVSMTKSLYQELGQGSLSSHFSCQLVAKLQFLIVLFCEGNSVRIRECFVQIYLTRQRQLAEASIRGSGKTTQHPLPASLVEIPDCYWLFISVSLTHTDQDGGSVKIFLTFKQGLISFFWRPMQGK